MPWARHNQFCLRPSEQPRHFSEQGTGFCCHRDIGLAIKTFPTIDLTMTPFSSLCLKILSLAIVTAAVLAHPWLRGQEATWVPWVAVVLTMLLDAYATDDKPASWSRWAAGFSRLQGPAMLPFYAALGVFLAFGPRQVRQTVPIKISPVSQPVTMERPTIGSPTGSPVPRPSSSPIPVRPPSTLQGSKAPRPGSVPSGPGGSPVRPPGNAPVRLPSPGGPQPLPKPPTSPTSSARPANPAK